MSEKLTGNFLEATRQKFKVFTMALPYVASVSPFIGLVYDTVVEFGKYARHVHSHGNYKFKPNERLSVETNRLTR